jgi:ornithine decarboxylase
MIIILSSMEDVALLQEYNVKLFRADEDDIVSIINSTLEGNVSEEAFFLVDIGKVIRQVQKWNEFLPDVKPFYAVKCNPNTLILKVLASLDVNFDCASKNEIAAVMNVTEDDSSRIVFANPVKMISQLKYARANDIDLMTFDSDQELYKIKVYHPYAKLILRIKVDDTGSKCRFGCKFGADMSDVEKIFEIAVALDIKIVGISFHVGSGCTDPEKYRNAIQDAKKCFEIGARLKLAMDTLDIGGGFEDTSNFEEIASVIKDALVGFEGIKVIAEPGRFFVSSSHTLVLNVIGKKVKDSEFVYYLNDGIYGSFNCIFFDHVTPVICPFNERDGQRYKSTIFGPTCDSIDKIADNIELPELTVGEWCYVENFGAYTCAASTSFNGFHQTQTINILTS